MISKEEVRLKKGYNANSNKIPSSVKKEGFQPVWLHEFSYRENEYRFLDHQNAVMGHLKIRLLSASCLFKAERSMLSPLAQHNLRPYIVFSVEGDQDEDVEACSNAAPMSGGTEFYWKEEVVNLTVPKETFFAGMPNTLILKIYNTEGFVKALVPRRVKGSNLLGQGALALNSLLHGEMAMIEERVVLDEGRGQIHVTVEYRPNGFEPQVNDIVVLESFARHPQNLVLNSNHPLKVCEVNGNWLLVESAPGILGRNGNAGRQSMHRIHRQSVFVVERLNVLDGIKNVLMKPTDAIKRTRRGRWVIKKSEPVVARAHQMLGPLYASIAVVAGTTKLVIRTAIGGTLAAVKGAWGANTEA